jgi:catechol 2,3-dioxygenase-like lactoylglutathione lyase family enzyme
MTSPSLALIVLRCRDLQASRAFYTALGVSLAEEQHGSGPVHYAAELGDAVFELYPGKPGAAPERTAAGATLLGFRVDDLDGALAAVRASGAPVVSAPAETPWGRRAVVLDPDGRAVELKQAPQPSEWQI